MPPVRPARSPADTERTTGGQRADTERTTGGQRADIGRTSRGGHRVDTERTMGGHRLNDTWQPQGCQVGRIPLSEATVGTRAERKFTLPMHI
jgi:hypothetical protein